MPHYRLRSRYVVRRENKDGLLFDSETGRLTVLNDTAASILLFCEKRRSRGEIIDRMAKRYRSPKQGLIAKEVIGFLREAQGYFEIS